jgi:predicted PurR-regulated permease PerM
MIKEEKQDLRKYLFWIIIAILLIASYFIIKPYIVALITSFILAFLVKPIYSKLQRKLNNSASAIICIGIITLIFILPIAGITGGIIQQSISILNNPSIQSNLANISEYSFFSNFNISPDILIPRIIDFFASLISTAAHYLPSAIISLIIIVISTYYILIKWDFLSQSL